MLLNEIVVKELIEHVKSLYKELIEWVDTSTQDTDSMVTKTELHLIHRDCLNLFSFSGTFYEHLSVKVVVVLCGELRHISEQVEDIYTLLKLLVWEVRGNHVDAELFFG
jgi:hypothetical protein